MNQWFNNSIFYHIYPLGLCGAPYNNDFSAPPIPRLEVLSTWLDHIQSLGANAIYLGPLFESSSHGYDTADYYWVDRRLGSNESLARFSADLHARGMRLVLDGVFNHVGRRFWGFRDVQEYREASRCRDWFSNLRFDQRSSYQDPFSYDGWNGHYSLVKLNLGNPQVREHLFGAIETWVREFDIDGLRLDTADCLDFGFFRELAAFCRKLKPDFWLMGEVIHGDYRRWVNPEMLDAVTNYECYKGLYSSLNDRNYFEIAYALERQFGEHGLYRGLQLYSFVDNHDVDRVATSLCNPAHLYPLYALLFGMPGVPSLYYGSEWGIPGKREPHSDRLLRPQLNLAEIAHHAPHPDLPVWLHRLAAVRRASPALQYGDYHQLWVDHQQFVFIRQAEDEQVIVALNAADAPVMLPVNLPSSVSTYLVDLFDPAVCYPVQGGRAVIQIPACGARILKLTPA